ncbi:MAG: HNH endonuclease [Peptostreptococcaceae bacterium]|nr:HNH endonuclease [Peptostreptococcaceae bacterium]
MKYIIKYNSKYKGFSVYNVEILEINRGQVKVKYNNKIEVKSLNEIYDSFDKAKIVAKERTAIRKFKLSHKNKNNQCECSICGRKVDVSEVTVDHIVPIKKFKDVYNLSNIRDDEEVHRLCFDESNLQIACKQCNQAKKTLPDNVNLIIERKARSLNCLKKNKMINGKSRQVGNYTKVGSYVSNSKRHNRNAYDDMFAYEICKRDSRIIPLNLIL